MKHFVIAILLVAASGLNASALDVLITDCGAVGDGKAIYTAQIQKAIDQVHEQGGGRVLIPRGQFVTGTLI